MRNSLCLLPCLLATAVLQGQTPDIEPPVVGRPARFSGIVALDMLSVTMEAKSPTTVAIEEPILVHLRLQGKTSRKHAPTLERLQPFTPEDAEAFFIEPAPEETRMDPRAATWVFGFRLRPRMTDVTVLPLPEIAYYSAEMRDFAFTLPPESEIQIVVKPRAATAAETAPTTLDIPATWRTPLPESNAWQRTLFDPSAAVVVSMAFGVPVLAGAWILLWRRRFGVNAEGTSFVRRSLRRTLAEIDASATRDEAMGTLSCYLRERLRWNCAQFTPSEVEGQLRRSGFERSLCRRWSELFRRWDEMRFAGTSNDSADWRAQARALVLDLEADPCASRLRVSR